jgi:hypothetical protein
MWGMCGFGGCVVLGGNVLVATSEMYSAVMASCSMSIAVVLPEFLQGEGMYQVSQPIFFH